ncbi:MAG: hypothetical protein HYX40_04440 [Sphingobacteriales bacterium]|nr:hypothetical protein [Sphingobacteriales bacterium]
MKKSKWVLLVSLIIFVALTILTIKNEADSDGFSKYGFPLRFYSYTDGKCDNCNQGFKTTNLLLDILISVTASYIIISIINRLKAHYKNPQR